MQTVNAVAFLSFLKAAINKIDNWQFLTTIVKHRRCRSQLQNTLVTVNAFQTHLICLWSRKSLTQETAINQNSARWSMYLEQKSFGKHQDVSLFLSTCHCSLSPHHHCRILKSVTNLKVSHRKFLSYIFSHNVNCVFPLCILKTVFEKSNFSLVTIHFFAFFNNHSFVELFLSLYLN